MLTSRVDVIALFIKDLVLIAQCWWREFTSFGQYLSTVSNLFELFLLALIASAFMESDRNHIRRNASHVHLHMFQRRISIIWN